jgi:DNA (cytosine-5)-methyltransferase 1
MSYTGISLFSGAVDGLAIAMQVAGIQVTHHVEIDEWCCKVLRRNFPHAQTINKDVKHVSAADFGTRPVDVVFGGPPCQGFSDAGDKRGFADERYLWPEMYRLVQQLQPRVVLVENVRGSVSGDGDNLADAVLTDLEREGYEGAAFLVPANVFGAPHERERVFIVAHAVGQRHARQAAVKQYPRYEERHLEAHQQGRWAVADADFSSREVVGYPKQVGALGSQNELGRCRKTNDKSRSAFRRNYSAETQRAGILLSGPEQRRKIRTVYVARMGRDTDGSAGWVDGLNPTSDFPGFPAGQGEFQYEYEPQRMVTEKAPYHKERIEALGNAVVWQQAYPFALAIAKWLWESEAA